MKWVYLPAMFALAFFYTKISFNDLGLKYNSLVMQPVPPGSSGRGPASIQEAEEASKIIPLAVTKIPAPVLYQHLSDTLFMGPFKKVLEFKGTVVGDIHVEGFGFLIDDKGKAMFGINEFHDVSIGSYLHDVFGHLVSAKGVDKKISWMSYFEAYKKGLQDRPYQFSYYVEKGLDDAIVDNQKNLSDNMSKFPPFTFTKLGKTHRLAEGARKLLVESQLKTKYPQIEILDHYEMTTTFTTYQLLVRIRPQDQIQWMELREGGSSGYDHFFSKEKDVAFGKRFELIKSDVYSGKMDMTLDAVSLENKHFLIKLNDRFSSLLKFRAIPEDDYYDIVLDEAYVLGSIHRKSLGDKVDKYIKTWATVPAAIVDEKAVELKYKFKDMLEAE